jgi:hypothetical protein
MKVTAFCDMATCSLVEVDPTFQRSVLPPSSGLLHACSKNSSIFQFVICTWKLDCRDVFKFMLAVCVEV